MKKEYEIRDIQSEGWYMNGGEMRVEVVMSAVCDGKVAIFTKDLTQKEWEKIRTDGRWAE